MRMFFPQVFRLFYLILLLSQVAYIRTSSPTLHPRDHPLLPSPPPPSPSKAPPTGRFADDSRSPPPGFKGSPSGRP
ncbi:hypothetical protein MKW98_007380 [Papaver atlanticum]|uniref:Uncharacterized protein n=1 Tax=Papaver atlanticum TaxID=357466 RepID=A0AAD4SB23_9MAGN|nr:hypothetical protein MKW98_007380 [Papaver atlanticum]